NMAFRNHLYAHLQATATGARAIATGSTRYGIVGYQNSVPQIPSTTTHKLSTGFPQTKHLQKPPHTYNLYYHRVATPIYWVLNPALSLPGLLRRSCGKPPKSAAGSATCQRYPALFGSFHPEHNTQYVVFTRPQRHEHLPGQRPGRAATPAAR